MDLTQIILYGDSQQLENALEDIDNVSYLDEYGYTPLIQAIIADKIECTQLLLQKGADVNQHDITGRTPLHWAVYNENMPVCELLMQYNADPNRYTISSEPILAKPILRNNQFIKKLLLEHGASARFAHDYINVKLLGHRFELVGSVDIVDTHDIFTEVDYEGFYLDASIDLIQYSLSEFRYNFAARAIEDWFPALELIIHSLSASHELLKHDHYLANYNDKQQACQRFLEHDTFILPINQEGHAFSVVKHGHLFAIIDRAKDSPPTDQIPIYYINRPAQLTADLIYQVAFEHQAIKTIHQLLKKNLSLMQQDSLPLLDQQIGNCSWANMEAVVPVMKFMIGFDSKRRDTQQTALRDDCLELFHRWQQWDRERILNRVIIDFKTAQPQRKAAIAALLAGIVFQRCDVDNEKDFELARTMLPIILKKDYAYLIESYKQFYVFAQSTRAGANFMALIDRYKLEAA